MIELTVVMAILGILVLIAVLITGGNSDRARINADRASLRVLNSATFMHAENKGVSLSEVFDAEHSDYEKLSALVVAGFIYTIPEPAQQGQAFAWNEGHLKWRLSTKTENEMPIGFYLLQSGSDSIQIDDSSGVLSGRYIDEATEILVPAGVITIGVDVFNALRGVDQGGNATEVLAVLFAEGSQLKTIGSRAFRHAKLTEIDFPSTLETIHNYAFLGNQLEELTLPGNVTSIGTEAFRNNPISKVTIESGVAIGDGLFERDNNLFREAYIAGGAGTYVRTNDGSWVKIED